MKKKYRLKKELDIKKVFEQKNSKANRQFVIYHLKKEQLNFRVCISVSKKLGNAVVRNKIKRKIRVGLQNLSPQIKENYDIIIIARHPVVNMDNINIQNSLEHVFKLSNLLK